MITRQQLIDAVISYWAADNEKEVIEYITSWNTIFDYSDWVLDIQMIITELWLSFYISELIEYWTIAYQERQLLDWEYRLFHLGNLTMNYESIEELIDELNKFEEQCI